MSNKPDGCAPLERRVRHETENLPVLPNGRVMKKDDALLLLRQAMDRIEGEPRNHKGRGWQCGGVYWRLSQVLEYYLFPRLEEQEGKEHADFIIENHGKISR
jgi:hypothetical protein